MKVTIAKALKLRNRLVNRISNLSSDIQAHNSTLKGAERDLNVVECLEERGKLVDALIALKISIFRANMPIYEKIVRLSEIKTDINFWRGVRTDHGTTGVSWTHDTVEYEAVLRKGDINAKIRVLESNVDQLQDELDMYNAKTEIEIPNIEL